MRYLTEFRYLNGAVLTRWETVEAPTPESLDDVAQLIGEYAEPNIDRIRVTEIGTGNDATAEALNHFGHHALKATDVWPWWLQDICPEWARVEAA